MLNIGCECGRMYGCGHCNMDVNMDMNIDVNMTMNMDYGYVHGYEQSWAPDAMMR